MSYQLRDIVRLHGRDFVFASRYWRENLRRQLSGSGKKSFVLCNSYPKSGTHLLYQILYSMPGLNQWNDIVSVQALCGVMNTPEHVRWKIGSAPDGSIIKSHLMYTEPVLETLSEFDCRKLFIYRDLRDVAVSHARWITKEERIFLHNVYQHYDSFDQQLMASIKGVPLGSPFGSNLSQPDIGTDFSRWQGWVNDPNTYAVKFEDLVGARGGGSEDKRLHIVAEIAEFLELELTSEQVSKMFTSTALDPKESHTFKKGGKGSIGGWRSTFNKEHKAAFKQLAGQTLIELGYEKDLNW